MYVALKYFLFKPYVYKIVFDLIGNPPGLEHVSACFRYNRLQQPECIYTTLLHRLFYFIDVYVNQKQINFMCYINTRIRLNTR